MVQVATAISAGYMKAGLVVSAESARQIVELMMGRLLTEPTMDRFKTTLATLTGGSGAIGVLLAHESLAPHGPRLRGAVIRGAPQHHGLCRWGPDTGMPSSAPMTMETHAIELMNHGVKLGVETWQDFAPLCTALPRSDRPTGAPPIDASICHQVGAANRDAILAALRLPAERDYTTYETLGNIGTVSLPITAALAAERGLLRRGDRVGWLGIGSGLNCLMLCVDW
jgi:3-oxoacyl-[acyl-carrier-protein] synthase III